MATIVISDDIYERIAKVAEARPYPCTVEDEIEKAIVARLDTWELFFFGITAKARKANFPDATDNTPVPLWDGGPSY